jgi:DNA-binding GntR family transcriptional regulator
MRERENVSVACATHKSVMAALRRRDLEAARAALRANLQTGYEPIASWLKARESGGGLSG